MHCWLQYFFGWLPQDAEREKVTRNRAFLRIAVVLGMCGVLLALPYGTEGQNIGCTTCKTATPEYPNPECRDCCNDQLSAFWKGNTEACAYCSHVTCYNVASSFFSRVAQNNKECKRAGAADWYECDCSPECTDECPQEGFLKGGTNPRNLRNMLAGDYGMCQEKTDS